jgi:predicted nucleic acid-binding Zn ribbon protein
MNNDKRAGQSADRPSRLTDLIDQVMSSIGQKETYHGWKIVSLWPEIVGPVVAKHSTAVRFADGTLTVVVPRDTWRQEIESELDTILKKIRSRREGKSIKKIVLRSRPITESSNE